MLKYHKLREIQKRSLTNKNLGKLRILQIESWGNACTIFLNSWNLIFLRLHLHARLHWYVHLHSHLHSHLHVHVHLHVHLHSHLHLHFTPQHTDSHLCGRPPYDCHCCAVDIRWCNALVFPGIICLIKLL